MSPEGRGESARQNGGDDAVDPRDAGAHRDQRKHVQVARQNRLPTADEEGPTGPQNDGRGENELDPVRERLIDPAVAADQVSTHLEDHHRDGEGETHPETAGHVEQFGIGPGLGCCEFGLERHAADRTIAGPDLPDLRMHRAGVDRAFGNVLDTHGHVAEILRRLCDELRKASL